MAAPRLPVLFLSHGGGPWPYVDQMRPMYAKTEAALRRLPQQLPARPKAVLVISGHWEAPVFSIATSPHPPMEYDYSGFPPHTYQIRYGAPGAPDLAHRVGDLLAGANIKTALDAERGFDHGVFMPLGLMYPDADMPIVMVSVKSNYDPAEHLALGHALQPLREEGVLIVGSGLTYHNMSGFGRDDSAPVAKAFTQYLDEAITGADARAREEMLLRWTSGPSARLAHPREDHLMPLLTAAGAAGDDKGRVLISETVMKIPMTSYVFGDVRID